MNILPDTADKRAGILFTATAYFDGMTWGDLREFVAIGAQYDVPDDAPVGIEYPPNDDGDFTPLGLEISFFPRKRT